VSERVIDIGDKLHIITRRLFDGDVRRHFACEITGISGELREVKGYAFVFNPATNGFRKLPELRTRLFSLGEEGCIVNKIPREVVIESLEYRLVEKRLMVTVGQDFALDINEF
jgi:hypothetical protein